MLMPSYPIYCSRPKCGRSAAYKIAARWSDGATEELKTYSLCCPECLPELFSSAKGKQKACRLAPGEILESPGIYSLSRGQRDRQLHRLRELEENLSPP